MSGWVKGRECKRVGSWWVGKVRMFKALLCLLSQPLTLSFFIK